MSKSAIMIVLVTHLLINVPLKSDVHEESLRKPKIGFQDVKTQFLVKVLVKYEICCTS